ncbi:MAG TPA: Gfo/Idh/MocA family oxidoreductase [Phycisphaerae bacterium]|nr:Gfo/Idh/MocA family oxidoreductase [Phycisphaerae bacterium]
MAKKIRWGILGPGKIARKFAEGLKSAKDAELAAVGSRSKDRAEEFGVEFGAARCHGSYEALADDPGVDAVYVATPHPMHKGHSLLCLNAGKAVLCEKPFAINAAEAQEVIAAARAAGVFCMEAMWTRFLPYIVKLRKLLADGAIGEVRMLAADFGFRAGFDPSSRLLDPNLGGGGLLDVGVYPVSLSSMILGEPAEVAALADLGATGVDEQAAYVLKHPGGRLAVLYSAVRTKTPMEAVILGTDGDIRLHSPWWCGQTLTVTAGGKPETIDLPREGNGYNYEAEEVGRCLRAGRTESDVMPLAETLSVMRTLDAIRAAFGLKYPME